MDDVCIRSFVYDLHRIICDICPGVIGNKFESGFGNEFEGLK